MPKVKHCGDSIILWGCKVPWYIVTWYIGTSRLTNEEEGLPLNSSSFRQISWKVET